MKSSSVASRSKLLRIWSKYATSSLVPCLILPLSACNSPKISFNSVVLPAPFGPSKPILSPRKIVPVKFLTITLVLMILPSASKVLNDLLTFSSSATILPLLWAEATSILTLPTTSRRAARLSRSSPKRLMRAVARVRRASTPLRIHTSSCARSLSDRALMTAS